MSAFEFFFSFYGLLLGLSVAAIATGLATTIQHRKSIRIGWLTPLLAAFVALDIASFWDQAWVNFRHLPFSYGLLVAGLVIAVVYFVAASLVYPHDVKDGVSLDDHFWANKKVVLLLLILANVLSVCLLVAANLHRQGGSGVLASYAVTLGLYIVLIGPAAFARKPPLFAALVGLHVVIYLYFAAMTALHPHANIAEDGVVAAPPAAPATH